MMKCSVGSARNRSTGSKRVAADSPVAGATRLMSRNAVRRRARARLARFTRCRLVLAGGTREKDTEDERGDADQTDDDEEDRVSLEQRAAGRKPFNHYAREPLRELADVRVRRAEQGVLRRGVADAGQTRHVGDENDAGEPDPEIV